MILRESIDEITVDFILLHPNYIQINQEQYEWSQIEFILSNGFQVRISIGEVDYIYDSIKADDTMKLILKYKNKHNSS